MNWLESVHMKCLSLLRVITMINEESEEEEESSDNDINTDSPKSYKSVQFASLKGKTSVVIHFRQLII